MTVHRVFPSYLHFGFLSSFEIARAVEKFGCAENRKTAFLEELIVRRELAYNFTDFNTDYDSLTALPDWVQQTMREHVGDERPEIFILEELENCETYDELWNATQTRNGR